jgi:Peptidase C13 family
MTSSDRVTHFAFVSSGYSGGDPHYTWYQNASQVTVDILHREYGYPNEAIYRLSEAGEWLHPGRGLATVNNFQMICDHLGRIAQQNDHVFIAIIGHGQHPSQPGNRTNDYLYSLRGDKPDELAFLSATAIAEFLKTIKARLTIAIHPCFSGGFLDKLRSSPDRVIVTSTNANESNGFGWIEAFNHALSLKCRDKDQGRSIKEIWEETKRNNPENPQLTDAAVAAQRYLGDNGKPLLFSEDALQKLRELNANLRLNCRPA